VIRTKENESAHSSSPLVRSQWLSNSEKLTGTIIIVGAPPLLRNSIARVVEQIFTPRLCATFEEAISELETISKPPVALILDVNLGSRRGDGVDIAQLAQDRFHGHIPTLILVDSVLVPEITERAGYLRAEFLAKPLSSDSLRGFLERVLVKAVWATADVLDLDRELQRFVVLYKLTRQQANLLFVLMRAAERGERAMINSNTRKAGLRRILKRTGYATFEQLRYAVKAGAGSRNPRSFDRDSDLNILNDVVQIQPFLSSEGSSRARGG
jgi:DNA-binding NarL/FixJ family response regulator